MSTRLQPPPKLNLDDVGKFLHIFFSGRRVHIVGLNPGIGKVFSIPANIGGAQRFIEVINAGGQDCYYHFNEVRNDFVGCKAAKIDMEVCHGTYADFDLKDVHDEAERARMYNLLDALRNEVGTSAIVETGAGFQVLWRCKPKSVLISGKQSVALVHKYEKVTADISTALHSDPSVKNLDRIMRMGGTVSFPNAAKQKKRGGRKAQEQTYVRWISNDFFDDLDDLVIRIGAFAASHTQLLPDDGRGKATVDGMGAAIGKTHKDDDGLQAEEYNPVAAGTAPASERSPAANGRGAWFTFEELRPVLMAIPHEGSAEKWKGDPNIHWADHTGSNYSCWINILRAMKVAGEMLSEHREDCRALAEEWSALDEGRYDAAVFKLKWDSIRDAREVAHSLTGAGMFDLETISTRGKITPATIFWLAKQWGHVRKLKRSQAAQRLVSLLLLNQNAYMRFGKGSWFDLNSMMPMTTSAFDLIHAQQRLAIAEELTGWYPGCKRALPTPSASMMHARGRGLLEAYEEVYYPGAATLVAGETALADGSPRWQVNTYTRGRYGTGKFGYDPATMAKAVAAFEGLAEILSGPALKKQFLGWLALKIIEPDRQLAYNWLIVSQPGLGKDTFGKVLVKLMGDGNVSIIGSEELRSQFNPWAARPLILGNELSAGDMHRKSKGARTADLLKAILQAQAKIGINRKYKEIYYMRAVCNMIGFSNNANPMFFETGLARRWVVVDRFEMNPMPPAFYAGVHADLIDNDAGLEAVFDHLKGLAAGMSAAERAEYMTNAPATEARDDLVESSKSAGQVVVERFMAMTDDLFTREGFKNYMAEALPHFRDKIDGMLGTWLNEAKKAEAFKVTTSDKGRVTGVIMKTADNPDGRDYVYARRENKAAGWVRSADADLARVREQITLQNAERRAQGEDLGVSEDLSYYPSLHT